MREGVPCGERGEDKAGFPLKVSNHIHITKITKINLTTKYSDHYFRSFINTMQGATQMTLHTGLQGGSKDTIRPPLWVPGRGPLPPSCSPYPPLLAAFRGVKGGDGPVKQFCTIKFLEIFF